MFEFIEVHIEFHITIYANDFKWLSSFCGRSLSVLCMVFHFLHRSSKQQIFPVKIKSGSTKIICSQSWFHRKNSLPKCFLKVYDSSVKFFRNIETLNFAITIF